MGWQQRFDRLLKAMASGEPHKSEKRSDTPNPDRKTEKPKK